ncbi:MAG: holo-ACP synthase [Bacteroidetes bacterium]|nr:holo-ACP synthase [Bacteroidota bacterium]MBS1974426.1 holo-ACP synthase [Bacteroidota bacterium]
MIAGIGTDMIEVERVASKINKEDGFREMVFSKKEIEYCEAKANRFQHYAARFAAKEAFLKATGTGWISGSYFHEIEILNNSMGQPEISLQGQTAITFQPMQIKKIFLSISHLKRMASAVVVIEN